MAVTVLENTDKQFHLGLPPVPTAELSDEALDAVAGGERILSEFAKIIAKACRDPAFKPKLIANPAAALKAEGIDLHAGIAVTVVENTDELSHLSGYAANALR